MSAEQVLVVPRTAVRDDAGWYGLLRTGVEDLLALIEREGRFAERGAMERDPSFKQIIPYLVLRDGDSWFLMRRSRAGVDARLHDSWSIGVGGHLNPGDADVLAGLRREWTEELDAAFVPTFTPIGLLNDDTTDVGTVHLGIVYVADVRGRQVEVRERHKLSGSFATSTEVAAVADGLESWSRLVFEAFEAAAVR